jgi:IS1 family transposase
MHQASLGPMAFVNWRPISTATKAIEEHNFISRSELPRHALHKDCFSDSSLGLN